MRSGKRLPDQGSGSGKSVDKEMTIKHSSGSGVERDQIEGQETGEIQIVVVKTNFAFHLQSKVLF